MSEKSCCVESWAGHDCHCDCEQEFSKWKSLCRELVEALADIAPSCSPSKLDDLLEKAEKELSK